MNYSKHTPSYAQLFSRGGWVTVFNLIDVNCSVLIDTISSPRKSVVGIDFCMIIDPDLNIFK